MGELNALVAHEDAEGGIVLKPEIVDETFLPDGDVEIAVEYSGINYKDALAVTPGGGVKCHYRSSCGPPASADLLRREDS